MHRITLKDVMEPGKCFRVKYPGSKSFAEYTILSADKVTIPGFIDLVCLPNDSKFGKVTYLQFRFPSNILSQVPTDMIVGIPCYRESSNMYYIRNYLNIHRNSKDKRFYMYMK